MLFAEIERLLKLLEGKEKEISELNEKLRLEKEMRNKGSLNLSSNAKKTNKTSCISDESNEKNGNLFWKSKWEKENKLLVDLEHKYNVLLKKKEISSKNPLKTEEKMLTTNNSQFLTTTLETNRDENKRLENICENLKKNLEEKDDLLKKSNEKNSELIETLKKARFDFSEKIALSIKELKARDKEIENLNITNEKNTQIIIKIKEDIKLKDKFIDNLQKASQNNQKYKENNIEYNFTKKNEFYNENYKKESDKNNLIKDAFSKKNEFLKETDNFHMRKEEDLYEENKKIQPPANREILKESIHKLENNSQITFDNYSFFESTIFTNNEKNKETDFHTVEKQRNINKSINFSQENSETIQKIKKSSNFKKSITTEILDELKASADFFQIITEEKQKLRMETRSNFQKQKNSIHEFVTQIKSNF